MGTGGIAIQGSVEARLGAFLQPAVTAIARTSIFKKSSKQPLPHECGPEREGLEI
jgi:hypothetical protein